MNVRRWMGVGATALVAGGCATHPASPSAAPAGSRPTPATPSSASDKPQWEARGGPGDGRPTPQQLADRTANYAQAMDTPGPTPAGSAASPFAPMPVALTSARGDRSAVRFDAPVAPPPLARTGDVSPAVAAPPPAAPRAAVLSSAARTNPLSDMPQEVPESADFAQPAGTPSPVSDPLGRRLAKRAHDNPRDAAAQLDYQLYQQLNDGPDASATGTATLASDVALPADERDVVAAVVDGFGNFRTGVRANPTAAPTQQIQPLQEMVERLRSGSDLTIGTVALCRRVDGFGRYEPITPARFPLGRASQVIVYCEVDNFLPQRSADGQQWETHLSQQVSLFTTAGSPVWEDKPRGVSDACRDRRRDFFAYERMTLPPTLPAGTYRLKVTITDRNANKVAESDVPLSIGA